MNNQTQVKPSYVVFKKDGVLSTHDNLKDAVEFAQKHRRTRIVKRTFPDGPQGPHSDEVVWTRTRE